MKEFERLPRLVLDGNLKENWKKCKRDFDWYLDAKNLEKATDKRKVAILSRVWMLDSYLPCLPLLEGRNTSMPLSWASLRNTARRRRMRRLKGTNLGVELSVKVSRSISLLRTKAKSCGFGELKDSVIRDQIVIGIHIHQGEEINL